MGKATANILLRTNPTIHKRLMADAKRQAISLHELCLRRVTVPSSLEHEGQEFLRTAVLRAATLFGSDLCGAVLYGSQARDEATPSSDWDLLLVLNAKVPITRAIYHRWDRTADDVDPRLEVHMVNLPDVTKASSGFWAEIATDGIVLYDDAFQVSKYLSVVRHDIIAGRIVRKVSQGQTYWVHQERA